MSSWRDLKNRLEADRRCYGFFHPKIPGEPLIFVEVALTRGKPATIGELLDENAPVIDPQSTDTAIFYSTGWSLADYEQAKARIQRAGQTAEKVQYFHLLARNTVDQRIMRALAEKRDLSRMVVDDWKQLIGGGEAE